MLLKSLILGLIMGYRKTLGIRRWFLPPLCRFYPSCSEYGYQAIEQHGLIKGLSMTVRRLAKCHPFHPGGLDPVPSKPNRESFYS